MNSEILVSTACQQIVTNPISLFDEVSNKQLNWQAVKLQTK